MTVSNRTRVAMVRETTPGTTPGSPRTRRARITRDGLRYEALFDVSDDLRDDRMEADPVKIDEATDGSLDAEIHYPRDLFPLSELYRSLFYADWANTPQRDNDGTADAVITDIATVANTMTFTTGPAFVVGHLVRNTGFTNAANNGLFPVTTGGATSLVSTASGWVAETVPPAAARCKVVGCQGVSGDITATATGLASTTLNFTTLGLIVGQWIKIGGTNAPFRFATVAANNAWVRITAIAANALTLDNLPAGWGVDAGATRTLRIFFGDTIKNGTTQNAVTIERGFMQQAVPTYVIQPGMTVNTHELTFAAGAKVTGSFAFQGMAGASITTTTLNAAPDAAPDAATYPILATSTNVGRIAEAGAIVAAPNFCRNAKFTFTNNLRPRNAIGVLGPAQIGEGTFNAMAEIQTYFGDQALLAKMFAGTPTSLNIRAQKGVQAMVVTLPRLTPMGAAPQGGAKNQDVLLTTRLMASVDTLTSCHAQIDRLEYFE